MEDKGKQMELSKDDISKMEKDTKELQGNFDVADRIVELIEILDGAYGESRKVFDMSGYILFFPDHNTYEKTIVDIWEFCHIEPTGYDYMDYIGDINQNGVKWIEKF